MLAVKSEKDEGDESGETVAQKNGLNSVKKKILDKSKLSKDATFDEILSCLKRNNKKDNLLG